MKGEHALDPDDMQKYFKEQEKRDGHKEPEPHKDIISPEDLEKTKGTLKKVMDIPGLELEKIHDLEYLYDIFAETYDLFKSLSFLKKTRKQFLDAGYEDSPAMNAYLFWITIERRLHIVYQRTHKLLSLEGAGKPEDLTFLTQIQKVSELTAKLAIAIETTMERKEKVRDVVDLHKEMVELAKKEIKDHIGEFVFKCLAEGTGILMADFSSKNIEDVKIGDEIIAFQEKAKFNDERKLLKAIVTNKIFQGKQDVIQISAGDKKLKVTEDHLFPCYRGNIKNDWKGWRKISDIVKRNWRVPLLPFSYIENKKDFLKGILLGFIDTDGGRRTGVQKSHPEWNCKPNYGIDQKVEVEFLKKLLRKLNINFTATLVRSGYTKRKDCFHVYIPTKYTSLIDGWYQILLKERICKDLKRGYIVGFILGDGSVTKAREGILEFAQEMTSKFNERVTIILEDLNIKYNKYLDKKNRTIFYYLNNLQLPFFAPGSKKLEKFFHVQNISIQSMSKKQVQKIGEKEKSPTWDLTTTCSSFIANGFLVHNCQSCDAIVNTQGLPHWAIEMKKDDASNPVYYVFSPELWYLFKKGIISMSIMAFALRTSPEGILLTAKHRGEKDSSKLDIDKEEEKLRKLMEEFEDSEYSTKQSFVSGE